VVFGKDDARQVTAMFSTEPEAQGLAGELTAFARGQSVLVAPFSGEDEKRIAALNAGERAMDAGAPAAGSAAQLQRDLQVASAHAAHRHWRQRASYRCRSGTPAALLHRVRHTRRGRRALLLELRGNAAGLSVSARARRATPARRRPRPCRASCARGC